MILPIAASIIPGQARFFIPRHPGRALCHRPWKRFYKPMARVNPRELVVWRITTDQPGGRPIRACSSSRVDQGYHRRLADLSCERRPHSATVLRAKTAKCRKQERSRHVCISIGTPAHELAGAHRRAGATDFGDRPPHPPSALRPWSSGYREAGSAGRSGRHRSLGGVGRGDRDTGKTVPQNEPRSSGGDQAQCFMFWIRSAGSSTLWHSPTSSTPWHRSDAVNRDQWLSAERTCERDEITVHDITTISLLPVAGAEWRARQRCEELAADG